MSSKELFNRTLSNTRPIWNWTIKARASKIPLDNCWLILIIFIQWLKIEFVYCSLCWLSSSRSFTLTNQLAETLTHRTWDLMVLLVFSVPLVFWVVFAVVSYLDPQPKIVLRNIVNPKKLTSIASESLLRAFSRAILRPAVFRFVSSNSLISFFLVDAASWMAWIDLTKAVFILSLEPVAYQQFACLY